MKNPLPQDIVPQDIANYPFDNNDDYDSPWKEAIECYFAEFMAFYFPLAYEQIDWAKGYEFLEQELRAVVLDAELGKRIVDKLVKVSLLSGEEKWIYIHLEIQGKQQAEFAERMYIYNYRLYDRYRCPIASMAVLADEAENWLPNSFGFEVLGCKVGIEFPTVKLLNYAGQEEALACHENPFAWVTLAHLLTRATRTDMNARYKAKWNLIQLLYQRGWEKQRVINLFHVLDWMMQLPEHLKQSLWHNIKIIEEQGKMRYVSSVEKICIEKGIQQGLQQGIQQGVQQGEALALQRILGRRFGYIPPTIKDRITTASIDQVEAWLDSAIEASNINQVFDPTTH